MMSRKVSRFAAVILCVAMLFAVSATAFATCTTCNQSVVYPNYVSIPSYYYGDKLYATTTISVYAGPGTNYPVIGYVSAGNMVKRIGIYGEFSQIEALDLPGYTAYVQTAYLSTYYYNPYPLYPWYDSCYSPCYNPCYNSCYCN